MPSRVFQATRLRKLNRLEEVRKNLSNYDRFDAHRFHKIERKKLQVFARVWTCHRVTGITCTFPSLHLFTLRRCGL